MATDNGDSLTRQAALAIFDPELDDEHFPSGWEPDEWVCEHYQRRHFGPDDLDVLDHLGHCYPVDYDAERGADNGSSEAQSGD